MPKTSMPQIPNKISSESALPLEKRYSYKLFDQIAQRYDFLNHLLSGGLDIFWRKKLVQHLPSPSYQVPHSSQLRLLDLATGTGDVAIELAQKSSIKKVVGLDLSAEMISFGRKKADQKNCANKIQFVRGDAQKIPFSDASFDVVTLSFGIRNFANPLESLLNIQRVLRPGGKVIIMEFSLPQNPLFKGSYLFYLRHILPFIGKILSGHPLAYSYLNKTIETFPYGKDFLELLAQSGFVQLQCQTLTCGITSIYTGHKPHSLHS